MLNSAKFSEKLLAEIKGKRWWQGSLISGNDLIGLEESDDTPDWWVIASQTCNLYNPCFDKVPYFELIAAKEIETCNVAITRGDHPRILHVEAQSREKTISLELSIQNRKWCKREILSELPTPTFCLLDARRESGIDWIKKQWLDKFVCWLTRSYSRVTLPDQFNDAVRKSKIEDVLKKKLTKNKDNLYGIYLALHPDSDDPFEGLIGEMLPPYLLNIVLVAHENVDPEALRNKFLEQLFSDQIKDPEDASNTISRSELAKRYHIRLIKEDIEVRTVTDFTLDEHKSLIRYSLVDHLSDSSINLP